MNWKQNSQSLILPIFIAVGIQTWPERVSHHDALNQAHVHSHVRVQARESQHLIPLHGEGAWSHGSDQQEQPGNKVHPSHG